jgi:hypothetical protein
MLQKATLSISSINTKAKAASCKAAFILTLNQVSDSCLNVLNYKYHSLATQKIA